MFIFKLLEISKVSEKLAIASGMEWQSIRIGNWNKTVVHIKVELKHCNRTEICWNNKVPFWSSSEWPEIFQPCSATEIQLADWKKLGYYYLLLLLLLLLFVGVFLVVYVCLSVEQVDDEKVVSGSYDKTLKLWDIKTGHCRRTLRSPILLSLVCLGWSTIGVQNCASRTKFIKLCWNFLKIFLS